MRAMGTEIKVEVNGVVESREVEGNQTLLSFLRDTLDLTGAKEGCNEGECGSCVVLLDGRPVNGCLTLAVEADGREVTTIEGLGHSRSLHPLQAAFLRHHAVQCGFCTPGMLMQGVGFLRTHPTPTAEEARCAIEGNVCRCTGYETIVRALLAAARAMGEGESQ